MLEELMAEFAVAPERVVMIGDTTHDLQMAVNAGCASVGVSYGAHDHGALPAGRAASAPPAGARISNTAGDGARAGPDRSPSPSFRGSPPPGELGA